MIYEKSKAKDIVCDTETLRVTVNGTLHRMATIVGATLGPGGKPVLIERDGMPPLITKDGVTVAKSLGLAEAEKSIVVEAAKEICINTAKEAGDGTTTAIVLANAIVRHGQSFIKANPKYNPQRIVSELEDLYTGVIIPYLKDVALKVESEDQLKQVATISANGDTRIADVVVKAVMAAGDDGTVLIEEGQGDVMRVDTVGGYIVTSGLKELGQIGPIFINDRAGQQAKMDNGLVFLYDGTMNDLKVPATIQTAYEQGEFDGDPILVFAHDFSDVVLDMFAKTTKGGLMIAPVKTPMSGLPNSRSLFLQDMAAYTTGKVYDPGNLHEVSCEGFGCFDHARVNMYESFVAASPEADLINARVQELKAISEAAFGEIDRMHIRAMIGKLTGGVSTVYVGGTSDIKIREKKARVEDAVEAVRSAIAEGVIPGGCSVQLVLADLIKNHPDRQPSWQIMASALEEPFKLLMSNCGEDPEKIYRFLAPSIAHSSTHRCIPNTVFDAKSHTPVNPLKAGILEPAKVCRVSINNALEVATLLITLGGIVVVPRDSSLENQLAMQKQAFKDMMTSGGLGQ